MADREGGTVLQDLERAVNLLKHECCAKGKLLSPVTPVGDTLWCSFYPVTCKKDFTAADRVVGKAADLLFTPVGIKGGLCQ